jgi:hypothetical protein
VTAAAPLVLHESHHLTEAIGRELELQPVLELANSAFVGEEERPSQQEMLDALSGRYRREVANDRLH